MRYEEELLFLGTLAKAGKRRGETTDKIKSRLALLLLSGVGTTMMSVVVERPTHATCKPREERSQKKKKPENAQKERKKQRRFETSQKVGAGHDRWTARAFK